MDSAELKLWRAIMNCSQEEAAASFKMSLSQYQVLESGAIEISGRTEQAAGYQALTGKTEYTPTPPEKDEGNV